MNGIAVGSFREDLGIAKADRAREAAARVCHGLEAKYGMRMWGYGTPEAQWPADYRAAMEIWDEKRLAVNAAFDDWRRRTVLFAVPEIKAFLESNGGSVTMTLLNTKGPKSIRGTAREHYKDLPGLRLVRAPSRGYRLELVLE